MRDDMARTEGGKRANRLRATIRNPPLRTRDAVIGERGGKLFRGVCFRVRHGWQKCMAGAGHNSRAGFASASEPAGTLVAPLTRSVPESFSRSSNARNFFRNGAPERFDIAENASQ